ncbi:MAG: ABC transporter permease subunit [Lachnospiraceae bacterium]|nr:ABC transporter permease subunit [Lachnospiraceae bacterium]
MKIVLNPIMKKEFKVTARSMKFAWGLMAYEAVQAYIFIMTVSMLSMQSGYDHQNTYDKLINLFPMMGIAQVCMVALVVPVMTASSISGEKERQTFDILLTTCLSPMEIVYGKVFSAVAEVLLYVTASIPVMALAFVLGGLSWWVLFLFLVVIFVFATFVGSVGVFCSSISSRSVTSITRTYGLSLSMCVITMFPEMILTYVTGRRSTDGMLFFMLNPVLFLEEFFMLSMRGDSEMSYEIHRSDGFLIKLLAHGPDSLWCILSGICILGLSLFFMYLAARNIDPLKKKDKKIRKKQTIEGGK